MRVLIVEDNPSDAAFVRALLEGEVSYVRVATRLVEAVAAAREDRFDVAILDMSLPDVSGLDALRALRSSEPRLPVVILSGRDDRDLSLGAVQAGAQDYQIKGLITEDSLRRTLSHAIERHQLIDRVSASNSELADQRASVIRINQLKNDLISVLAHDFKGPLTSILGYSELIEEGLLDADETRDAARTIARNVSRLAALANDTLALSSIEQGELDLADERVDVLALVREIVTSMGPDAERVSIAAQAKDTVVRGDPGRLRQVFENVIRNALKYSREPSPIDVLLDETERGLKIDVTDHGIGIPADELGLLFKRFSRASNAKKAKIGGTGIGLFLVKTLVEKHGGQVAVRSDANDGTTFSICLPRSVAPGAPGHVAVLAADKSVGPFIVYTLRSNGYRVREYRTPELLAQRIAQEPSAAVVVHADSVDITADALRSSLGQPSRLIAIGGDPSGWDVAFPSSFLAADLLAALEETPPASVREPA
ncbi:MAG TPA: hybrid sensor histidine kinase/response regulator [Candidatus Baltobacteraceae bacterium]